MFGFPEAKKKVYPSTFLRKVVIEFGNSHIQDIKSKSDNIKEIFQENFPRSTFGKQKGFSISIGNDENPNFETVQDEDTITLKTQDGQIELLIGPEGVRLSVEGKKYKSFEKTIYQFIQPLKKLFKLFNITNLKNCSIRKINLVEFSYSNENIPNGILDFLLRKELIYNDDAFPNTENIRQNMHIVDFKKDDYGLNIRYGMNTLPQQEKDIGQLVVDLKMSANKDIEMKSMEDEAQRLNNELYKAFSWIFNDKAKQILIKNESGK